MHKMSFEFSDAQIERLDEVCNITVEYLEKLLNVEITEEMRDTLNNAAIWCEVAGHAADVLLEHDLHAHFPTRCYDDDCKTEFIEDYYGTYEPPEEDEDDI